MDYSIRDKLFKALKKVIDILVDNEIIKKDKEWHKIRLSWDKDCIITSQIKIN